MLKSFGTAALDRNSKSPPWHPTQDETVSACKSCADSLQKLLSSIYAANQLCEGQITKTYARLNLRMSLQIYLRDHVAPEDLIVLLYHEPLDMRASSANVSGGFQVNITLLYWRCNITSCVLSWEIIRVATRSYAFCTSCASFSFRYVAREICL